MKRMVSDQLIKVAFSLVILVNFSSVIICLNVVYRLWLTMRQITGILFYTHWSRFHES